MADDHDKEDAASSRRVLLESRGGRIAAALFALVTVGTIVGLIVLWPSGAEDQKVSRSFAETPAGWSVESGTVTAIEQTACPGQTGSQCVKLKLQITSGSDDGEEVLLDTGNTTDAKRFEVGQDLRLAHNPTATGANPPYSVISADRSGVIYILAAIFGLLVLLVGGWHGVRSLFGLAASILVIALFILPGIVNGTDAFAIAIVGAFAVMLLTIALTYGINIKSVAAALGTAVALLVTAGLAALFTELAGLTGIGDEAANALSQASGISLSGLVLAGAVIAALGVLDDVTVSQASTVMALRRANPAQSASKLFREAMSVGRDHISATVNTLVLAYAGASLPVLLVLAIGSVDLGGALSREAVAEQVVATLVGSIGLITAVPISTWLAALLAARIPGQALPEATHAHAH